MTDAPRAAPGGLRIRAASSRGLMAREAAGDIARHLRHQLRDRASLRMMFAAAPSQQEMLDALVAQSGIDWRRVTAFHMDEYIGLPADAPQLFAAWLDRAVFTRLPFAAIHRIDPAAFDTPLHCAQDYARRIAARTIDVICLGIGVNGHLAFNDPPVADFADPHDVKLVELDAVCRQQQVDDGCFPGLDAVPTHALTVTIPALMRGAALFCVVPGAAKRDAVRRTLADEIGVACPATILRTHPDCTLYLDAESNPDG